MRHQEEPEEAHHVVDPHAARVAHRGAQHVDERPVAGRSQPPGDVGRDRPVLARRPERIGRSAHAQVGREQVALRPGVESVRREADRDVGDQPDRQPWQCGSLLVEQELQIGVPFDLARRSFVVARCPRAERSEVGKSGHGVDEACERLAPPRGQSVEAQAQRLAGNCRCRIAVDQAALAECPPVPSQLVEARALGASEQPRLRHRVDIEVQRIAPEPARRAVGARIARRAEQRRGEGVDEQERGVAEPRGEGREAGEIDRLPTPPLCAERNA